jgi:hypothetical protein
VDIADTRAAAIEAARALVVADAAADASPAAAAAVVAPAAGDGVAAGDMVAAAVAAPTSADAAMLAASAAAAAADTAAAPLSGGPARVQTAWIAHAVCVTDDTPLADAAGAALPGMVRLAVHPEAAAVAIATATAAGRPRAAVQGLALDGTTGVCPRGSRVVHLSVPLACVPGISTAGVSVVAAGLSAEAALGPLIASLFDTARVGVPTAFLPAAPATTAAPATAAEGATGAKPSLQYAAFYSQRVTTSSTGELGATYTPAAADASPSTPAASVAGLVCVPDPWLWEPDVDSVVAQTEALFWRHCAAAPGGVIHPSLRAAVGVRAGAGVGAGAAGGELEFFKARRADGRVYDLFGNPIEEEELQEQQEQQEEESGDAETDAEKPAAAAAAAAAAGVLEPTDAAPADAVSADAAPAEVAPVESAAAEPEPASE